jgi:hypothetical protein
MREVYSNLARKNEYPASYLETAPPLPGQITSVIGLTTDARLE